MSAKSTPYWRLSGFYFFYFATLGTLIPFWGLYLKSLGFDAAAIGAMMGIIMATKIISPNIWGWIADHTGKRMAIVRLGSLLALLSFTLVLWAHGFWSLALVMVLFSFFWNAVLPQFEATTFNHMGEQTHRYSSIRLWGSVGFIVLVWGLGEYFQDNPISHLPFILLALYAGIWLSSLSVPEEAAGHLTLSHEPLSKILKRPEVTGLLLACFLMQASHGPYYALYSVYMEENGYSVDIIGRLWALGVIAEVIIFMVMLPLMNKVGVRWLLIGSLLLASLRWMITGYFPLSMSLMIFAQLLHAATFGVYHAAAIHLVHKYFTGKHHGKGQALYSSLSFGAGGALGSYYSGLMYENMGAESMYISAAVLALVGAFITFWKVR